MGLHKHPKLQTLLVLVLGLLLYLVLMRGQGTVKSLVFGAEYAYIAAGGSDGGVLVLELAFSTPTASPTPKMTAGPATPTPSPTPQGWVEPTPTSTLPPHSTPTSLPIDWTFESSRVVKRWDTLGEGLALEKIGWEDKDYLFVAEGAYGLKLWDVTELKNPIELEVRDQVPHARAVVVFDGRMFVASERYGVFTWLVEGDPEMAAFQPARGQPVIPARDARDIFVYKYLREVETSAAEDETQEAGGGRRPQIVETIYQVCVAAGREGVLVVEMNESLVPVSQEIISTGNRRALSVWADGSKDILYIAAEDGGVLVYDIFSKMEKLAEVDTNGPAIDVLFRDGYLYVAAGPVGLQVYKENPGHTYELVAVLDTPGRAVGLASSNFHNFIFVADESGGVRFINVTDPKNPIDETDYQLDWGEAPFEFLASSAISGDGLNKQAKLTVGNMTVDLTIASIALVMSLVVFAGFVLPVHTPWQRLQTIWRMIVHWFKPDHAWFIRNGQVDAHDLAYGERGPGVVVLDAASAAVFKHLNDTPRPRGPGVVFTRNEERLYELLDLRRKALWLGPHLDESPFEVRGEGELQADYRGRYYRREQTKAMTRDGVEVAPTLRVVYSLDGKAVEDGTQFDYDAEAVLKVADGDHPQARYCRRSGKIVSTREEIITCAATTLWQDGLARFKLAELFGEVDPGGHPGPAGQPNGLNAIVEGMRQRLTQAELPGAGGGLEPNPIYQEFQARGLQVHAVSLEAVHLAEDDRLSLLQNWHASWSKQLELDAQRLQQCEQERALSDYALAAARPLKERLKRVIAPVYLKETLLLMLRGTLGLCPAGSSASRGVGQMIEWVENNL